ncbi:hypothetical protein EDD11_006607 [Mortierella claussenii]|nr:hypothetical protein EDD11_006607 [Mortierella claussenii]
MDEPIKNRMLDDATAGYGGEGDPEVNDGGSEIKGKRDLDGAEGTRELPGDAESLERQEMIDHVQESMQQGQFAEINCTKNLWSVTASDAKTLEGRLLEAIQKATSSSGQGKQVFVME